MAHSGAILYVTEYVYKTRTVQYRVIAAGACAMVHFEHFLMKKAPPLV